MRWGVCCASTSLGTVAELMSSCAQAGVDYLEFGAGEVADERQFETLRQVLADQPLRVEAWNSFVPAERRITGPNVDLSALLSYCETILSRVSQLSGEIMVLGSGAARRVPDGFDAATARAQFVAFCRELGPIAQAANVTVCLEPLNTREDNLLNTVEQGAQMVDEVAHPNVQLLADLYHMTENGENTPSVASAGARLRHTHGADLGRVAPGFASDGEADFRGFFSALREAGYDSRFSFEGRFDDMSAQLQPMLAFLRDRAG